ncbi:MAG: Fic family protein [Lachnospiraceae bacterium]|nr:Fic family protein [Lachnospiraceae bacterium]
MDNKYSYSYERTADYCYPDSDVLINKLNIKDSKELFIAEREFVSYRVALLLDKPMKGNFDFKHLKAIHKHLFQDVFHWAGKSRKCNIAKTNWFCLAQHIDAYAEDVFGKINKSNYYLGLDYDSKITALAELFADIIALHPFREGNGRTQREFIGGLAKVNGIKLDFTKTEAREMIIASSESTAGNMTRLFEMFKKISISIDKSNHLKAISDYVSSNRLKSVLISNV